jgi:hypothetical protein
MIIVKAHRHKRNNNNANRNTGGGGKGQSYVFVSFIMLGCVFGVLQVLIFISFNSEEEKRKEIPLALQIKDLQEQLISLQASPALQIKDLQKQLISLQASSQYADDGNFFPFTIRDSRHLVPTQISKGFHVFDYVDLRSPNQINTRNSQLFHSGFLLGDAPCQEYNIRCYKQKILQVFDFMLAEYPDAQYFFYIESDNDLCVSLSEIRNLTYYCQRYFISTGIGFSGYIMSRQFVMDFLQAYRANSQEHRPDPIAAWMLIEKNSSWSATRKYLVSHSIIQSVGSKSLTVKLGAAHQKHLPKCFEPRREKWSISKIDPRDLYGWDYFDYDACPDADIFPCKEGQLAELVAKELAVIESIVSVPEEKIASKIVSVPEENAGSDEKKKNEIPHIIVSVPEDVAG